MTPSFRKYIKNLSSSVLAKKRSLALLKVKLEAPRNNINLDRFRILHLYHLPTYTRGPVLKDFFMYPSFEPNATLHTLRRHGADRRPLIISRLQRYTYRFNFGRVRWMLRIKSLRRRNTQQLFSHSIKHFRMYKSLFQYGFFFRDASKFFMHKYPNQLSRMSSLLALSYSQVFADISRSRVWTLRKFLLRPIYMRRLLGLYFNLSQKNIKGMLTTIKMKKAWKLSAFFYVFNFCLLTILKKSFNILGVENLLNFIKTGIIWVNGTQEFNPFRPCKTLDFIQLDVFNILRNPRYYELDWDIAVIYTKTNSFLRTWFFSVYNVINTFKSRMLVRPKFYKDYQQGFNDYWSLSVLNHLFWYCSDLMQAFVNEYQSFRTKGSMFWLVHRTSLTPEEKRAFNLIYDYFKKYTKGSANLGLFIDHFMCSKFYRDNRRLWQLLNQPYLGAPKYIKDQIPNHVQNKMAKKLQGYHTKKNPKPTRRRPKYFQGWERLVRAYHRDEDNRLSVYNLASLLKQPNAHNVFLTETLKKPNAVNRVMAFPNIHQSVHHFEWFQKLHTWRYLSLFIHYQFYPITYSPRKFFSKDANGFMVLLNQFNLQRFFRLKRGASFFREYTKWLDYHYFLEERSKTSYTASSVISNSKLNTLVRNRNLWITTNIIETRKDGFKRDRHDLLLNKILTDPDIFASCVVNSTSFNKGRRSFLNRDTARFFITF